jgi:hypothetical protein
MGPDDFAGRTGQPADGYGDGVTDEVAAGFGATSAAVDTSPPIISAPPVVTLPPVYPFGVSLAHPEDDAAEEGDGEVVEVPPHGAGPHGLRDIRVGGYLGQPDQAGYHRRWEPPAEPPSPADC